MSDSKYQYFLSTKHIGITAIFIACLITPFIAFANETTYADLASVAAAAGVDITAPKYDPVFEDPFKDDGPSIGDLLPPSSRFKVDIPSRYGECYIGNGTSIFGQDTSPPGEGFTGCAIGLKHSF